MTWLGDYRVVDLSRGLAGAYATKLLADAGAEVVLVEPEGGHPLRRWTASGRELGGETGPLFRFLSAGKRSAAEVPEGADLVVVDEASDVDPGPTDATVLSLTPYGRTGPWAGRPATDFIVQAECGSIGFRGRRDQPPVAAGGRLSEWVTGAYGAVAALAAPPGEHVDCSALEAMTIAGSLFLDLMWSLLGGGEPPPPARTLEVPSIEPTADGWVGFNTNTRQQFDDFLVLIERPDLLGDPDWPRVAHRVTHMEEWNAIVHAWTRRHPTAEIVERAAALRIPVAPVVSGRGVLDIDHFVERGVFVTDATGTFRHPRSPYAIDGERADTTRAAPDLHAHDSFWVLPSAAYATGEYPERGLPLEGVRVIDATAWWAGPEAGRLLALLGADVLHLEATRRPDGMRMAGGLFFDQERWWERSAISLSANTGKRGITLDLTTDDGRALLDRLLAGADVLLENYSPRVAERFELTPERLHVLNPDLVYVRMPAFGLDGPWRDRVGFAQTMEQVTGMAWVTGHVDDQPRIPRGPCDPLAGAHAAFAVLVALRRGGGAFIESTMVEAALNVAAEQVIEWTAHGVELERMGNRAPGFLPQGLYPCAGDEQWLALSVADDDQWKALVDLVGLTAARHDHDAVDAELAAWAAEQEVGAAVEALLAAGVPAGEVRDPRTISRHPQLVARGFFEALDHPVVGRQPFAGLPFRFGSVDRWLTRPAPTMGEHDHEVLGGELGLSDDEIARLEEASVIGTEPIGV
jgi:crotonobetainyl-CoA:carnitine CoA-transferase CaiB-like acyl-CoA transferase